MIKNLLLSAISRFLSLESIFFSAQSIIQIHHHFCYAIPMLVLIFDEQNKKEKKRRKCSFENVTAVNKQARWKNPRGVHF